MRACARMRRPSRCSRGQLHIAIIGAGATGVELAAELHNTMRELVSYGLDRIDPERDIKITLIEAATGFCRRCRNGCRSGVASCCRSSTSRC